MSPFQEKSTMGKELGPLAGLVGAWEGDKGKDISPSAKRATMETPYRERMEFAETGQVDNHEQVLYGLRYRTTAWRLAEDDPFHEELGYWLWDAKAEQVLRCFMVPRGVTIMAGGTVKADARAFELSSDVGSETYGICSNQFLDREFKTVRYELSLQIKDDGTLTYEEDTQLRIKGQGEVFHHTDSNTLRKV
jgi:hypothetical protein